MTDDLRSRLADALAPYLHTNHLIDINVELDDVLDAVMRAVKPAEPEDDLAEQMRRRELGVYRLFWHSGGCSVASVGQMVDGSRWYAPANWTFTEPGGVVSTDWSGVKQAELIESCQTARRKRPRKDAA